MKGIVKNNFKIRIYSTFKNILIPIVRFVLFCLPFSLALKLIRGIPKLAKYMPNNREVIYEYYLEDIKIKINTLYPVERSIVSGRYEDDTLAVIDRCVRKGDYCIDIGANIGAITFALAKKVGSEGKAFAFEPGKLPFKRLLANLDLNPKFKGTIIPINMGISEQEGVLYWKEVEDNRGNGSFLFSCKKGHHLPLKNGEGEPVVVSSIDNFFKVNPLVKIDFLKIDAECMEQEVIKGALKTIERFLPILYYETLKICEILRKELVLLNVENMLRILGYKFFKIDKGKFIETKYPDFSNNTLAIPDKKLALLKNL